MLIHLILKLSSVRLFLRKYLKPLKIISKLHHQDFSGRYEVALESIADRFLHSNCPLDQWDDKALQELLGWS